MNVVEYMVMLLEHFKYVMVGMDVKKNERRKYIFYLRVIRIILCRQLCLGYAIPTTCRIMS